MGDLTPDVRASDAERDDAVETLNRAAATGRLSVEELEERLHSAYTSRTRRELELLVADVNVDDLAAGPVSVDARADGATVREGAGGARVVASVMGGNERSGRWRIASRCTVLNVMGGSELDLCDAEFANRVTRLNVYTVMGGGEIRVPHGVDVQVSKIAIMGGNEVRLGEEAVAPGAPQIRIRLVSIMGGVSVRRGRKLSRAARRRKRELESEA